MKKRLQLKPFRKLKEFVSSITSLIGMSIIKLSICLIIALLISSSYIKASDSNKNQSVYEFAAEFNNSSFIGNVTVKKETSNLVFLAAPHLPKMQRFTGEGRKFYGEKYEYKSENQIMLLKWMSEFPEEVKAYKSAISKYLSETNIDFLSAEEKEVFYDLKSQWLMASQLIK